MSPSGSPEFRHVIKSGLGPHVVGQRVVVRRVLPGQTGPSGGPALTDLLGVCESWTAESTTIRAEDGTLTEIALADIVSGKPVPPRPSRFRRLGDADVEARCDALRAGPPPSYPVDVQIIGLARLVRELSGASEDSASEVRVVERPDSTLAVEVGADGTDGVKVGSAVVRYDDSWALLLDLSIEAQHRHRGNGRRVLAALAEVLAEQGLSVLVGEIPTEDAAARRLAATLGFELHHTRG